ncbi:AAA family ATPase [Chitinibacter sp. ZOR0017]|uniref:MinD/ParA family ATP-binding protein n=1 Tax=Chitinibacter sp. ZOR0017 TaxID=1339254 RepID=UPI000647F907|nr:AAA family ATPase [Chitinibacter sp. ZOR0017]
MPKRWQDQAAGLRQLVNPVSCRSISLCGGRGDAGTTTLVIHLAAALAERQREVMILDEFSGAQNVANRLHLQQGFTLEHVLRREATLADCLIDTPLNAQLLPLASRPHSMSQLNEAEQSWLAAEFEALTEHVDYLLLDTRPAGGSGMPSLSLAADDVVIVLSDRAESLTDAYAAIKQLALDYARRDFRVLVNRVDNLTEAMALFERLRSVCQQFLGSLQLKLIGFVPEDAKLNRAMRLGRSVLEAYPDTEASIALRQLADVILRWIPPTTINASPGHFVHRLVESSRLLSERLQHG